MSETILVVNAGSSSIKFQLFAIRKGSDLERSLKGQIEGIGTHPYLIAKNPKGEVVIDETWPAPEVDDVPAALDKVIDFLRSHVGKLPIGIGHRVVHGGPRFSEPVIVSAAVVDQLLEYVPLAPLHQPNNLRPIRVVLERQPHLMQVACFDTAFHRGHPEVADRYALPEAYYAAGIRRYGFHGLSYEYISGRLREQAPELAKGRVIVAHLGSGASMCALVNGKSVESTMGFTALDGLPMGTRPGQLDAGIVLYLLGEKKVSAKEVEHLFYHDCGLKGLSGLSNDVRDLLASPDPRAKLALDYFAYRIALFTGQLAAAMEGLDAFVFTAGIGENAPAIRAAVASKLNWLGFKLSSKANEKSDLVISRKRSRVVGLVIPTDEELMIARHTLGALHEHAAAA
ncbi:Acetate kinase [Candidatus Filomicrobium marinum]|uniref:Acetate kinase n=1 Tax=Candidatus Filomicrobium marinum TaxID=1608628 RepID=A0A0D6JK86_9HYPH|nr:acetate/propionate family kinase [Candidatus Filomicrobium marinum]CFX59627.1 Acetate kinase [Candidatus Filomicrobium marinum]CPR22378.1 Acetate kinase [Candidatus Filomicrobium marinum]